MRPMQRIRMGLLLANIKLGMLTRDAYSGPKDPNPENWRTISGAHVHLENGRINGGAGGKFSGNNWVGKEMHASDPRAQEGNLFGQYGWSVGKSKTEREEEENKKKLKTELNEYHSMMLTGQRENAEWQAYEVYEAARKLDHKSKEYKEAIKAIGWSDDDVKEIEEANKREEAIEAEQFEKNKAAWERNMAANKKAAEASNTSELPQKVAAINSRGHKIFAELLDNGNVKWGMAPSWKGNIWENRGGMEGFLKRLKEKGYSYAEGETPPKQESNPKSNKNHPYWKTPEGKAEKYFAGRSVELEGPGYSREDKIQSIYEAGGQRVSKLQNKAAAINNKIDKINRKRGALTKEDEVRLKELNEKRIPAEREANAWANEFKKWRDQFKPKEKEIFQRTTPEELKPYVEEATIPQF